MIIKMVTACVALCLLFAAPLRSQEDELHQSSEDSSSAEDIRAANKEGAEAEADEEWVLADEATGRRAGGWHLVRGGYSWIPAKNWRSQHAYGIIADAIPLSDDLRLMNYTSYGYRRTTRNYNFPDQLHTVGEILTLTGSRFSASAGVISRSDRPFSAFDRVNIYGSGSFRVWDSGPHSIHVGMLFSSRGEVWQLAFPLPTLSYRFMRKDLFASIGLPMFLLWKPHKRVMLVCTGMLPGVGRALVSFSLHEYVSLSFSLSRRKEPFYPATYPYRDWRRIEYQLRQTLNYHDEDEERKKLVLETNQLAVGLGFNYHKDIAVTAKAGLQFKSSYYLTRNIYDPHPDRERIADSWFVQGIVQSVILPAE